MKAPACQAHRSRTSVYCRGFTLLELLVVLFIIGITLSFAVLTVGDRGREQAIEQEAQRLAARLNLAAQESILQAREMALEVEDDGYQFVVYIDQKWRAIDDDEVLRPHRLPAEVTLKLELEGEPIRLGNEKNSDSDSDSADDETRIYLLSSGEMTPFELTLDDEFGSDYRISGAANGKLKVRKFVNETRS